MNSRVKCAKITRFVVCDLSEKAENKESVSRSVGGQKMLVLRTGLSFMKY